MRYQKESLREVRFPLGGIGTGCVSIAGNGRLCDWEMMNRPAKGSRNGYSHIAVSAKTKDGLFARVLHGDHDGDLTGQYEKGHFTGYGFGPSGETMCGFPHFENVVFDGEFPIARLTFTDAHFPGRIVLTAFSPFIPRDAHNSSIPAAFFDVAFENDTDTPIAFTGVFSVRNPFDKSENIALHTANAVFLRDAAHEPDTLGYGDMTIAADAPTGGVQEYWYRGGWQDSIVKFWNELSAGALPARHYEEPAVRDTASVYGTVMVQPGKQEHIRFALSWNVPIRSNDWKTPIRSGTWKNHYATIYPSSKESARYALEHFDELFARTDAFRKALFEQTLDESAIDAAASTLAVLRSPTVLRLENGEFYGWEGVHEQAGSCEGTCQHVWNYAYALCFLFPELERSIHDLEIRHSMAADGGMQFRLQLPLGSGMDHFRPCVDGQMGTVLKIYRDWKICGDTDALRRQWDAIKKMIAYAWCETNADGWDRDKDGVLEGRQHHTLDMELFGPHAWLEGFYLGALKAGAEMARELGDPIAQEYQALFEKGYAWTKENLFNGSYFIQKLDLNDKSVIDRYPQTQDYWEAESGQIKYQIADGCEIDQLCAQWHANIIGLGDLFDPEQKRIALASLFRCNYKPSMRNFVNPWRIFALNDEAATIICDYPSGTLKPVIPLPYCEESMNGFEYQLAGLLISEGLLEEGLTVVRAVRARYNGRNRNPYNEIECGSNYARSMASFALIPIFSGFRFDMPHHRIGFRPVVPGDFRSLWSLDCGYGTFERKDGQATISVIEGELPVAVVDLPFVTDISGCWADGKALDTTFADGSLRFDQGIVTIHQELKVAF